MTRGCCTSELTIAHRARNKDCKNGCTVQTADCSSALAITETQSGITDVISVFFRYDDFSSVSPISVDAGLIDLFRSYSMCCTFAVIPAVSEGEYHKVGDRAERPLSGEKLELLSKAVHEGVVDLALHGWNHRAHASSPPNNPSEFSGLTLEQQTAQIRRGVDFFRQTLNATPTVFVPPWNTHDRNTLHALETVGLAGISAHRYSPCIESVQIRYAPMTVELRDLRIAIETARRSSDPDPVVGVMMHPYDFCESNDQRCSINFAEFEGEIRWLAQCSDVRVKSISSLFTSGHTLGAGRFRDNRPSALESIFPPFIRKTHDTHVYMSSALARKTRGRRVIATLAFYLAVAVFAFTGGIAALASVSDISETLAKAMQYAVVVGVLFLLARGIHARRIYFRGMTLLSGLGGMWMALLAR